METAGRAVSDAIARYFPDGAGRWSPAAAATTAETATSPRACWPSRDAAWFRSCSISPDAARRAPRPSSIASVSRPRASGLELREPARALEAPELATSSSTRSSGPVSPDRWKARPRRSCAALAGERLALHRGGPAVGPLERDRSAARDRPRSRSDRQLRPSEARPRAAPGRRARIAESPTSVPPAASSRRTSPRRAAARSARRGRCCRRDRSRRHKGDAGRVLVVGGSPGKTGAVLLARAGALRGGAGLVTLAARAEVLPIALAGRPEAMSLALPGAGPLGPADLPALLAASRGADALVVGPGTPPRRARPAALLRGWLGRGGAPGGGRRRRPQRPRPRARLAGALPGAGRADAAPRRAGAPLRPDRRGGAGRPDRAGRLAGGGVGRGAGAEGSANGGGRARPAGGGDPDRQRRALPPADRRRARGLCGALLAGGLAPVRRGAGGGVGARRRR